MFDAVTPASSAFAAVGVDAAAAAVVSVSSDNSVAGDASDGDSAFVDDSVAPLPFVVPSDDSSLLLSSPDRVSSVGVTSLDVSALVESGAAADVSVVGDAESLALSPPLAGVV